MHWDDTTERVGDAKSKGKERDTEGSTVSPRAAISQPIEGSWRDV